MVCGGGSVGLGCNVVVWFGWVACVLSVFWVWSCSLPVRGGRSAAFSSILPLSVLGPLDPGTVDVPESGYVLFAEVE